MNINPLTAKVLVIFVFVALVLQGCQHNYYRSKRRGGGKKGCGCPGGFSAERSTKDGKTSTEVTNTFVFGNVSYPRTTESSLISQP